MGEWEDTLPPLMRDKLIRIGEPSAEEKAKFKELGELESLLALFFKGVLNSEGLYNRLKEYESQGKQFLLKEAQARLESSFRANELRIRFEEASAGTLSVRLLEKPEAEQEAREEKNLVIDLTGDNFEQAVRDHRLLVVDCWAEWCAPCKMLAMV